MAKRAKKPQATWRESLAKRLKDARAKRTPEEQEAHARAVGQIIIAAEDLATWADYPPPPIPDVFLPGGQQFPVLNATEDSIVQALRENAYLKGEELAAKAGYPFSGHFKGKLAEMVKRGLIANTKPRGYHISKSVPSPD